MKKVKLIKVKKEKDFTLALQYLVTRDSNSPIISMAVHRLCKRFVLDLQKIPLSDELQ